MEGLREILVGEEEGEGRREGRRECLSVFRRGRKDIGLQFRFISVSRGLYLNGQVEQQSGTLDGSP